ncbi:MAG: hypothetical protein JO250_10680 [Armatimonadetes bacterium]|nr:hypothetical protein [Armatimonadota bacterium]
MKIRKPLRWGLALLLLGASCGRGAWAADVPVVADVTPLVWEAGNALLRVRVHQDGGYSVLRDGDEWLTSAPTALHCGGQWYSAQPGAGQMLLKPTGTQRAGGHDALGEFISYQQAWDAGGTEFQTSIRVYRGSPTVVFAQGFPKGAQGTALTGGGDAGVLSAFPCFQVAGRLQTLRYFTYRGTFAGVQRGTGLEGFAGGTDGGVPLVLLDPALHTVVLSPLNRFKAGAQARVWDLGGVLACGVQGQIERVPAGFTLETIFTAGQGVTDTLHGWGSDLLAYHGKRRGGPERDDTVRYLGYWTDNGAYYYYHTEPRKNYEETLRDMRADHVRAGIPFHYYQLDSWWYFKGPDGGVARWEARPDVFPDGVAGVHRVLGLPLVMHNRWWSPGTDYARRFPFVTDGRSAVPVQFPFWEYLMAKNKREGMRVYEQDWLVDQFHKAAVLRRDALAAGDWLDNMGRAASENGLTIQYCMPLPADVLQSSEIPAVTQTRVSGDYHPGNGQWRIGATSLLAWALGLAPFKDTFWTTADEPGSPYGPKAREPNAELETLASALSAGPVGPGDAIGQTNVSLLMKVCRADGLLLKPDKPATPIDRWFLADGPDGEVWDADTDFGPNRWHYMLAADLKAPYTLRPDDLHTQTPCVAFDPDAQSVMGFDAAHPLTLAADRGPGAVPFTYLVIAPRSPDGWAFLGETGKLVTVSRQRFADIAADGSRVTLRGVPGEAVTLQWSAPAPPARLQADGDNDRVIPWTYDPARHLLTASVTLPPRGAMTIQVRQP